MASTKKATQFSIPIGIENHDPNLEKMVDILAKLRRRYLDLEPGTAEQQKAYEEYDRWLKLQATGVMYVPKF